MCLARETNDVLPRVLNFVVAKPGRIYDRAKRFPRTARLLGFSLSVNLSFSLSLSLPSLLISIFN